MPTRSWPSGWTPGTPTTSIESRRIITTIVEYHSPFVARLADGRDHLDGKEAVRDYVALARFPDLELGPIISVAPGAGSVAAVYRSVEGLLAIETLVLGRSP